MAHNLTIREDGRTEFFSAVTRGWHNLGQLSDRKLTAEEAIKESLLDWGVVQAPVYHQVGEDWEQIPNQFVVRRTDTNAPLSIMSDRYVPIQNSEAFGFFDDIIGAGQAVWDTAGSIAGGRKVFMQAELEGKLFLKSNPDDVTVKRILFLTSHDGSKALTGMITPVRVVCQNTLNAALKSHSNCFKVYHRKNYMAYKEEAAKVLELAHAYFDDLQVVMDTLSDQEVTRSYVEGFINTLMPAERNDKGEIAKRTSDRRSQIETLFQEGAGNNGRTKWDLYNAVTEYVDHHSAGRIGDARKSRSDGNVEAEARFERALLGSGANLKQKALDILLN